MGDLEQRLWGSEKVPRQGGVSVLCMVSLALPPPCTMDSHWGTLIYTLPPWILALWVYYWKYPAPSRHLPLCQCSLQVCELTLWSLQGDGFFAWMRALHPGTILGLGSDSHIVSSLLTNEYGFLIPKAISKCVLEGHTEMKPTSQS